MLFRSKKHSRRKPRARSGPTLRVSVIKVVSSPSEHSPFLDMTINNQQCKTERYKDLHVKVQLNTVLDNIHFPRL